MMTTTTTATETVTETDNTSSGGRLVTADGRTLPLESARLRADACAGVARAVLEQRFVNPYDEPLRVTYLMPLPADGAVSGYAFSMDGKKIVGEVDKKARARERFERALSEGRTAGLVEQERSSLFTQELGNIPPRSEVVAEITVDQKLAWLDEGAWEWRFPTAAGPRYLGAPGRVPDAAKIDIAVADAPLPVRIALALSVRDKLAAGRKPESPAHALAARQNGDAWHVELAEEGGARLDRDLVVRWAARAPKVGVACDTGRPATGAAAEHAYALMTLVPPAPDAAEAKARKRDLILLIDTSGSMGGEPIAHVKKVCAALIDSLGDDDRLELIEFSTAARRFKKGAIAATREHRAAAKKWLMSLEAGGGTEMVAGVLEALAPLGPESQRQVVLLTDGYIGFETEVVKQVRAQLPAGSRLHVVGVGSSVNRSLTMPSARAGRGVEVVIAPGEDPERAVRRLLARTAQPIVTDLSIDGAALVASAPARLPDLYAGSPALCALKLRPEGGTLTVRGKTAFGAWEQKLVVPARAAGVGPAAAATLWARETVEDLELDRAAGGDADELDRAIERLGLVHQIATRLTTWVAVSHDVTVDPTAPTRREEVPQELPHGVSAEGLGLRRAAPMPGVFGGMAPMQATVMAAPAGAAPVGAPMAPPPAPSPARARAASPMSAVGRAAGAAAGIVGKLFKRDEGGDADDVGESEAPKDQAESRAFAEEKSIDRLEIDGEAPEPVAPPEPAKKKAKPPIGRRLRARIVLSAAGELVIEWESDGADWAVTGPVAIERADGSAIAAVVDTTRTTRAGAAPAGQTLRLALRFTPGGAAPRRVTVTTVAGPLVLEVA
jgi:Ca-activated chloride channel family protein